MPEKKDLNKNLVMELPTINTDDIEGTFQRPDILGQGAVRIARSTRQANDSNGITVPNGSTWVFRLKLTIRGAQPIITTPMLMWDLYVDTDNSADDLWPYGANIGSSNRPRVNWSMVNADVNPNSDTDQYAWGFAIKNESGVNQDYYFYARVHVPFFGS